MSTQDTAALVQSVNKMTETVAGKMGEIDGRMDEARSEFDQWRQQKDVSGDANGFGTMRMNIFQGHIYGTGGNGVVSAEGDFNADDLGSDQNVYIHFKTPLNVNVNSEMFWFNIRGYSYGASAILDEVIVGYCYKPVLGLQNVSSFGNMTPGVYEDENGNVVLRILMPSIYYTTIRVDTMRVGNGRLFGLGDLDCKMSLSDVVKFE